MTRPKLASTALPFYDRRTGLAAIGFTRTRAIWPVMGGSGVGANGSGSGEGSAGGAGGDGSGSGGEPEFPPNTPVAQMTAEQQAAYWRTQSRKHEDRAKSFGNVEELRTKAAELERLQAEQMTEQQKAVAAAKVEGQTAAEQAAAAKYGAQLAGAEIRIAAAGRVEPEVLAGLMEHINLAGFLGADGLVDADKVTQFVDKIAPPGAAGAGGTGTQQRRAPDMGQGRRQQSAPSGRDLGKAEALKRFGDPAAKNNQT